ncbi:MAG: 16S rRNA (guanine(527)-N(7))-methyltransferase RsmG [Pseudomonadales bacterium]|jgi:16S rRNA (guanine527-N7)-methyltransferase
MQIVEQILKGLEQLPFHTDNSLAERSAAFLEQLARWNKTFNLTAIRSVEDMIGHHLMDSFSIAPFIKQSKIIDVGSGAGFPGLPLAMLYPDREFVLIDSNGKKTRFITQVVFNLEISNVEVVHSRAQDIVERTFDHVLCRAVASLPDIASMVTHLVADKGNVLAQKGKIGDDTTLPQNSPLKIQQIIDINVPLVDGERCMVEMIHRKAS